MTRLFCRAPWLAFVLIAWAVELPVKAQEFPLASRNITFVLPYAVGGPTDKAARDLALAMSKELGGHPILVENVTGASGSIGTARVARAANDGISALIAADGTVKTTLPRFKQAVLTGELQPRTGLTPYAVVGNWPVLMLCMLACLGVCLRSKHQ